MSAAGERLLESCVVVVTGASGGHGEAYVRAAVAAGAKVVANDLASAGIEGLREELGDDVLPVALDVGRDGEQLVERAIEHFGRIDAVVNNAGIAPGTSIDDMDVALFDRVLGVNLRGPFLIMQAAARHWLATGTSGRVVNVASRTGLFPTGGRNSAYGASKAGLVALTIAAAEEHPDTGITFNVVCPRGWSGLRPQREAPAPGFDRFDPEHLGPPVVYLASARSAWCNGQVFSIDGDRLQWMRGWAAASGIRKGSAWNDAEMHVAFRRLLGTHSQMADEDKGGYAAVSGVAAYGRPVWLEQG